VRKETAFGLLIILFVLVVGSGFAELLLRLVWPQQTLSTVRGQPGVYRRSDYLPFELQPGAEMRWSSPGEHDVTYRINAQGFRSARLYPPVPPKGTIRYLALGDSFTFGHGVREEEAWPAVLERLLTRDGATVEVVNAAYACGFSPDAYALYYRHQGFRLEAHTVLVELFTWNDIDDIRNNDWLDVGPDGMPARIRSRVTYVDASGRRLREERYPLRLRLPILRDSHLFQLLIKAVDLGHEALKGTNQQHQHTDTRRADEYTRRAHERELAPELVEPYGRFRRSLTALRDDITARGARLLVIIIPSIVQLAPDDTMLLKLYSESDPADFDAGQPNRRMADTLQELGIRYVDLLPRFQKQISQGKEGLAHLYFRNDGHFTARGQALAAELIQERLSTLP